MFLLDIDGLEGIIKESYPGHYTFYVLTALKEKYRVWRKSTHEAKSLSLRGQPGTASLNSGAAPWEVKHSHMSQKFHS